MKKDQFVILIEPSYYGIGYVDAVLSRGCKIIAIVSSSKNPEKYGYEGKYHDLIIADIRNPQSIFNAIQNSAYANKIEALIPATDYATHITAKVAERLNMIGNSYNAALRARNKDMARVRYAECDVTNAMFSLVSDMPTALAAISKIGYPAVIKPTNCASSQNVFMINDDNELRKAIDVLQNFEETYMGFKTRKEYLIEEYINGPEFSVEIFTVNGETAFASVTEKLTTPPPYFAELAHTVPTSVYCDKSSIIIDVAAKAVHALGFNNGPCHVEVKLSQRGPIIIETNGRPGGDEITRQLLVNAFGINFFEATVDYYLGRDIDLTPKKQLASTIAYLTATKEGKLSSISGIENITSNKHIVSWKINAKRGDLVQPPKNSDDRLGHVITVAKSPDIAKHAALDAVKKISFEYDTLPLV